MKLKCDKCGSTMELKEGQYICSGCDNSINESEAKIAVDAGKMVFVEDKQDLNESVELLFEGVEQIDESFIEKAKLVFESAIKMRVDEETARIQAEAAKASAELIAESEETLAKTLEAYLEASAKRFMKENRVAIENTLRVELMEDFMEGLKSLFAENYIDVPEDKVEVVESLAERVEELEDRLNREARQAIYLEAELLMHKKADVIHELCEGMAETQAEKFVNLVADIEFDPEQKDAFVEKAKTIKESLFKQGGENKTVTEDRTDDSKGSSLIAAAVKQLAAS